MSDEPRDPQLEDLFALAIETALANARTMLPGRVVSYNSLKQSASIQPLAKEAHVGEDAERVVQQFPELHDVPVRHIGGASGRITVPVVAGDLGMIVFASSSIARWKLTGKLDDPGDDRHHDISDCVFEPGLHDFAHVPTTAPTDAIVMHGMSKIGGPLGTEPTLMATTFLEKLATLLAAIATAVGTSGTPAGATAAAGDITTAISDFYAEVSEFITTLTEVK